MPHLTYDDDHYLADGETGRRLAAFLPGVTPEEAESIVGRLRPPADQPPREELLGRGVADSLPGSPEQLILLALRLLDIAETDQLVCRVRMASYHQANPIDGTITLGLAGCLMRYQLRANPTWDYSPRDFAPSIARKLRFVQIIASGKIHAALGALGVEVPAGDRHKLPPVALHKVPYYHADPAGFKRELGEIARILSRYPEARA